MPFAVRDLEHPIVQAPMGGGVSTPALAAAVSDAGGLGFLAAGYKPVDAVRADVDAVRALTDRPFGINLFAPPQPVPDPAAVERYARALAERHGDVGAPRHDDDGWEEKLALVAELRVPVVSFAFGCPDAAAIDAAPRRRRRRLGHGHRAGRGARGRGGRRRRARRPGRRGRRPPRDVRRHARRSTSGCSRRSSSSRPVTSLPLVATGGLATGRAVAAVLVGRRGRGAARHRVHARAGGGDRPRRTARRSPATARPA